MVANELEGPVDVARPALAPALPRHWPTGWRLVAGGVALGLMMRASARRGPLALVLGGAGVALGLRAIADRPLPTLVGLGEVENAHISATIRIEAPIDRVFAAWSDLERFPTFMKHVRDVVVYGDGHSSCWLVIGPAGVPIEFDAEITTLVPGNLIAWRSLAGSAVRHHGTVRFTAEGGGTRVHVRIAYEPPAGALGSLIAASIGADPARWLRADLLRLKRRLERESGPLET